MRTATLCSTPRISWRLLVVAALGALGGVRCTANDAASRGGSTGDAGVPDASRQPVALAPALVRIAQWSPSAPQFDVCLCPKGENEFNSPLLGARSGANSYPTFPQAAEYVSFPAGQYDARVVAAGSSDCRARITDDATSLPPLAPGSAITLALVGSLGSSSSIQLLGFADDRTYPTGPLASGAVALRFIHASPLLPDVDFGFGDVGSFEKLFLNVPFGSVGDTKEAIAQETSDSGADAAPQVAVGAAAGDAASTGDDLTWPRPWSPPVAPIPFVDPNGYASLNEPLVGATLSAHVPYSAMDLTDARNVSAGPGAVLTVILTDPPSLSAPQDGGTAPAGQLVLCVDALGDAGPAPPCSVVSQ
jgi:hypothetical protein